MIYITCSLIGATVLARSEMPPLLLQVLIKCNDNIILSMCIDQGMQRFCFYVNCFVFIIRSNLVEFIVHDVETLVRLC